MPSRDWSIMARSAAVLGLLAIAGFPFYWMLVTSLTPSAELFSSPPRFWPSFAEDGVYRDAFWKLPVRHWLINSLLVAAGTTLISLTLELFLAYSLSCIRICSEGLDGIWVV